MEDGNLGFWSWTFHFNIKIWCVMEPELVFCGEDVVDLEKNYAKIW